MSFYVAYFGNSCWWLFCSKWPTYIFLTCFVCIFIYTITTIMTSHEHHGMWSHQKLNCFFISLFKPITKKISITGGFPDDGPVTQKVSCHDFILCPKMLHLHNMFIHISYSWLTYYSANQFGPINSFKMFFIINEYCGISNHWRLDCLFNSWFRIIKKENITAPHDWPLWGESTCDRWIPLTKGQ